MLTKLIKYDFKSLNRYLIAIHIMLLIVAVLGRFTFVGRLMKEPYYQISDAGMIVIGIGIFLFIIIFMVAVFGTLILVGIHFYKNLFSDEGYLTHTLPVSRGQLLAAKTISGSIWIFIDEVLLILSGVILIMTRPLIEVYVEHKDEIKGVLGVPKSMGCVKFVLLLLLILVISAVTNALTLYVSIVLGQLFANHRVLGAVVAYFCVNTVVSILSGLIGSAIGFSALVDGAAAFDLYSFYVRLFVMAIGMELVLGVVFYIVTYVLMKRKLNLN